MMCLGCSPSFFVLLLWYLCLRESWTWTLYIIKEINIVRLICQPHSKAISHAVNVPFFSYLRCFSKMHPSIEKSAKKKTIAFSIVFPLTPHFRHFSVFQRVLRLYWEVIVFRLPVFLEFRTFFRHENAPQLCIKIGVRIWLKTLILIQCTLWLNRGCIFVWAKSYRFRLKIWEGVNCSM